MGKTNLVPLMTYFTAAEYEERKSSAKRAGLSISNFNRAAMGYAAFKPGKPKKKIVPAESSENSISFETVADFAERSGEFENPSVNSNKNSNKNSNENSTGNSNKNLKDFLPTEADVEDAFSNLMGITETASRDERAVGDTIVEARTVSRMPEQITGKPMEKITAKVEGVESEDFIPQNQNDSLDQKENLSQPSLFS